MAYPKSELKEPVRHPQKVIFDLTLQTFCLGPQKKDFETAFSGFEMLRDRFGDGGGGSIDGGTEV